MEVEVKEEKKISLKKREKQRGILETVHWNKKCLEYTCINWGTSLTLSFLEMKILFEWEKGGEINKFQQTLKRTPIGMIKG